MINYAITRQEALMKDTHMLDFIEKHAFSFCHKRYHDREGHFKKIG